MTRASTHSWQEPAAPVPMTQTLPPLPELSIPFPTDTAPPPAGPVLDAHEEVYGALRESSQAIAAKRLKVSVRLLARNHYFTGDRELHRRVMQNLLRSAIATAPAGGHLTIRSTRPADCALRIEIEERSPWLRKRRVAKPGVRRAAASD